MGKGIDCVRMNIQNGRLDSAGWQATVTYYSNQTWGNISLQSSLNKLKMK
jgi:hypothetical protein